MGGNIQLNDGSDTTLSRFSAGIMAVEGKRVVVSDSAGGSGNFVKFTGANTVDTISNVNYVVNGGVGADKVYITGSLGVGSGVTIGNTSGLIKATNDIVAYATSDKRLKENIRPIPWAVDKVKQINGVYFDWIPLSEEEEKTIHGNKGHDIGVIAQEIEAILPELVTTRDNGYKAVKYDKIVALLIEAIKEQQGEIDELRRKIK